MHPHSLLFGLLLLGACDRFEEEPKGHPTRDPVEDGGGDSELTDDSPSAVDTGPYDQDGDGYVYAEDCDDTNASIHPGAAEQCNIIDDDCDGTVDEDDVCPCPVHYWPDESHPYLYCEMAQSWTDASDYCSALGYQLATVDSAEELSWITETSGSVAKLNYWWLGFTDAEAEGSWKWMDGSEALYINWCDGEPNNSHGQECYPETTEDCAMLNWGEGGCWNDYPCGCDWPYFICEGQSENRPDGEVGGTG